MPIIRPIITLGLNIDMNARLFIESSASAAAIRAATR